MARCLRRRARLVSNPHPPRCGLRGAASIRTRGGRDRVIDHFQQLIDQLGEQFVLY